MLNPRLGLSPQCTSGCDPRQMVRTSELSDDPSVSSATTPVSQLAYENRDALLLLQHRVLHLEERLHSAENQIESNNRRLTWLEQFIQRLRGLVAQLC